MPDTRVGTSNSAVSGVPRLVLRLEGLTLFVTAAIAYGALRGSWLVFALLFFVPDVSLAAYLRGPRIGAVAYNVAHSYVAPATVAGLMASGAVPTDWGICCIWIAHIGFDRALGYGLKFSSAFKDTHLGVIGAREPM